MKCCGYCFKDVEIKGNYTRSKPKGQCDFCAKNNVYVVDIDTNTEIKITLKD